MPPKSLVVITEYSGGSSEIWAKKSPGDQCGQRGFQIGKIFEFEWVKDVRFAPVWVSGLRGAAIDVGDIVARKASLSRLDNPD